MSDDLRYDGKVAVITGAGGGLGRSHAMLLASRGAKVVVNDLGGSVDGSADGSMGPADKVVAEIKEAGGEAIADGHSVSTPEGAGGIIKTAVDAFGRVDIIINNAGILRDKSFRNLTPELYNPVLEVHLNGSVWVAQAAWELMREQKYGRVIHTSSAAGIFGNFGQVNYGAAKMGIVGLSNVMAVEGAKYNIKSNVLAPGAKTRMTEDLMGGGGGTINMDPSLVSPIVGYLAHESCSVSGEIYSAASGRISRVFIGVTKGIYDKDLTLETVRDRLEEIRDEANYSVPKSATEEMALIVPHLKAQAK